MDDPEGPPRFQAVRIVAALMVREMITRYGRTWGGYVWAILEPVGMIAILSLTFSQFVRSPPVGQSFVLFYASGYIPFHFFNEISGNTSSAIQLNRPLMQFPMVTPIDAVLARFLLSLLTLFVVTAIVFAGILLIVDEPIRLSLPELASAVVGAAILGLGVGTTNAFLFSVFPVWRQLWAIINRPLFLISGIFFSFGSMPESIQKILWWNPIIHTVGEARAGFYPVYDADYVSLGYVYGCGIAGFILGCALLARHRSWVVEQD